ncbi:UNVERIFIED_CONTAM: hypothetical protein FKN15_059431 [Acipenser sinensis]
MMMKRMIWLISGINRRMMKFLIALALIAYIACNCTPAGENQRFGSQVIAPLQEKIRDLEVSFTQKYPPVKFLSEKDRKRILLTGGAGFVGSHLADKLMMDGHEVTVVDNFFTGRKRNVEHWIGHENFELINHDVVEPLYIEGLAKRVGARLLLASTSEVYGDPEVHPQSEEYWGHVNPIGPRACYDEGKRVAETMCYAYMKQEGVEVRVARIFNTFGSRMHMNDGRVVSNFILQALQGEPLTSQVQGIKEEQPVCAGLLYRARLQGCARAPRKRGSRSQIQFLPEAQDDPQRRKPDITKAKMMLGWEPVKFHYPEVSRPCKL